MEITDWRATIDALDEQIVELINRRARAAQAIGQLKRNSDLPVYEPKREQQVFDHVRAVNQGPLDHAEMLHVYERIIDVMRTLQQTARNSQAGTLDIDSPSSRNSATRNSATKDDPKS